MSQTGYIKLLLETEILAFWEGRRKFSLGFFARFKLLYLLHQGPLHLFTNVAEKERKEHAESNVHISTEFELFCITFYHLSTCTGKELSFCSRFVFYQLHFRIPKANV